MQTLVLKTVKPNFEAFEGFKWKQSGRVACPDWDPSPICGGGLHGLLWGEGNSELLNHRPEAKWLVLEVDSKKIVDLGGKVKFPYCNVLYAGERDIAVGLILERNPGAVCVYAKKIVGDIGTAHVGDYGKATAGHYGKAIAGHHGTVIAGDYGRAIAGEWGNAEAGVRGTAIAGNDGTAIAGYCGTAIAGYCGTATAGHYGAAIAENYGMAKVRKGGRIEIAYFDGKKYRKLVGYEGEEIEANKFYRVVDGKFVEII